MAGVEILLEPAPAMDDDASVASFILDRGHVYHVRKKRDKGVEVHRAHRCPKEGT